MRLIAAILAFALCSVPALAADVLTSEGLGPVKFGMSNTEVEKATGTKLKLPKPEPGGNCAAVSISGGKGTFMFFDRHLVRIDIKRPGVTTAEGAGVGMNENELRKIYGKKAEFTPHRYGEGPGDHYVDVKLGKDRLLIFETMKQRVDSFRIGTQEAAQLVEGCS